MITKLPEGVCIVVVKDGKVATSRRLDAKRAGMLQFPGGKVEPGEFPINAAQRELREETGANIECERFACLRSREPAVGFCGERYLASAYLVVLKPHEHLTNPEPEKHTDWVFVTPARLAKAKLLPSSRTALDIALRRPKTKAIRSVKQPLRESSWGDRGRVRPKLLPLQFGDGKQPVILSFFHSPDDELLVKVDSSLPLDLPDTERFTNYTGIRSFRDLLPQILECAEQHFKLRRSWNYIREGGSTWCRA